MTLLLLALIPALLVLLYYYNRDRHPEPWGWVAVVFLAGAASLAVVLPLERAAHAFFPGLTSRASPGWIFLECLLIPGLIEESVKLLVVVVLVYGRSDFDEPVDGLIYGTAAALGFTFAEDWYKYVHERADWTRVFSTFAHPWFSCFWAAALGWAKFHPWRQAIPLVLGGLAASVLVHGLYDFMALAVETDWSWLRYLVSFLLLGLYFLMEHLLERADTHERERSIAP
jgi:RsiW-degrading membrane proteinase PrsW (M82 family)